MEFFWLQMVNVPSLTTTTSSTSSSSSSPHSVSLEGFQVDVRGIADQAVWASLCVWGGGCGVSWSWRSSDRQPPSFPWRQLAYDRTCVYLHFSHTASLVLLQWLQPTRVTRDKIIPLFVRTLLMILDQMLNENNQFADFCFFSFLINN